MKSVIMLLFSVIYLTLFITNTATGQEVFTVNTSDKPPYSTENNSGVYDKIILRIFDNIGIKVKINRLSSARSIENVDLGLDDAEYARIKGLSDRYKNLRLVDERLIDFAFTAFAKNPLIIIDGWDSLSRYNVAFMRGWKIYEKNVVNTKSTLMVSSEEELFGLLAKDRVDIILYELLRGRAFMKRNSINGIVALQQPLSTRGMYLYVNKKHETAISDIENSLRLLKKSGEYQQIVNSATK